MWLLLFMRYIVDHVDALVLYWTSVLTLFAPVSFPFALSTLYTKDNTLGNPPAVPRFGDVIAPGPVETVHIEFTDVVQLNGPCLIIPEPAQGSVVYLSVVVTPVPVHPPNPAGSQL